MACKYICDACGKEKPGAFYPNGTRGFHKPHDWYERQDKDGIQVACSRPCIDAIAKKSGKTGVVLPI